MSLCTRSIDSNEAKQNDGPTLVVKRLKSEIKQLREEVVYYVSNWGKVVMKEKCK